MNRHKPWTMDYGLWTVLVAGTFIMMYLMAVSGKPLKTPITPHGIIDLEFAYSKAKVLDIVKAWKDYDVDKVDRIATAKENTYLDFIFLLFYSPFLFLCCRKLIAGYNKEEFISKSGRFIAKGALLSGLLDMLENLGMLQSLNGNVSGTIALFTSIVSVLKWALVITALIFIIYMLVYTLSKRKSRA